MLASFPGYSAHFIDRSGHTYYHQQLGTAEWHCIAQFCLHPVT